MNAYLLTNHLLNFAAPAAFVALLLVGLSRIFSGVFRSARPLVTGWWAQLGIVFAFNLGLLTAGLLWFGRDGKMLTYAALVAGAALCQWVMLRGWRR